MKTFMNALSITTLLFVISLVISFNVQANNSSNYRAALKAWVECTEASFYSDIVVYVKQETTLSPTAMAAWLSIRADKACGQMPLPE